jgi:hypothetical protein
MVWAGPMRGMGRTDRMLFERTGHALALLPTQTEGVTCRLAWVWRGARCCQQHDPTGAPMRNAMRPHAAAVHAPLTHTPASQQPRTGGGAVPRPCVHAPPLTAPPLHPLCVAAAATHNSQGQQPEVPTHNPQQPTTTHSNPQHQHNPQQPRSTASSPSRRRCRTVRREVPLVGSGPIGWLSRAGCACLGRSFYSLARTHARTHTHTHTHTHTRRVLHDAVLQTARGRARKRNDNQPGHDPGGPAHRELAV